MQARKIHINGIVQGVGFRPNVARIARALGCTGWVLNDTHGVTILVQNPDTKVLDNFERQVVDDAPPAARILQIESSPIESEACDDFTIHSSENDAHKSTLISPDLATCDACVEEMFDPNDRRYHYPFINCTNCGPRFTIINDLPYDRENTSMAAFKMCDECAAEYADETDRRYHAQPDACFECGPLLWWLDAANADTAQFESDALALEQQQLDREESDALIKHTAQRLKAGDVLAIKGLGGWHLACDATNEVAVAHLRERKHRPSKPLAVMVKDLDIARELATLSAEEETALKSVERPIVLVQQVEHSPLAPNVTSGLPEVGIMLPATPLQHLLMHAVDTPLVMTSGNRSGEPIVASDKDAIDTLRNIADGFLGNNRAIVARYDDSVLRIDTEGNTQLIRRARGFAPTPLMVDTSSSTIRNQTAINGQIHSTSKEAISANKVTTAAAKQTASIIQKPLGKAPIIFAAGPEQKATFTTLKENEVFISQHLGDLEHLGAMTAWKEAQQRYECLFDLKPQVIACDMHPEYLSSKWARTQATNLDIPLIEVQHHHAHIASVLGENELNGLVIGVALDGTGYGIDGTIWGGEILIAERKDFERFWHLPQFKLPGGAAAIMNPERTAYAVLKAYSELDDEFFGQFSLDNPQFVSFLEQLENKELLDQMMDKDLNSPLTSSAGRLFDAISALLGTCTHPSYDGEAASLLEAAAHTNQSGNAPLTALSFHEGFINAIIEQVLRAKNATGITDVALSGGCMVNRIIYTQLKQKLQDRRFAVYTNRNLPPNDGCISYGQAIVARARLEE